MARQSSNASEAKLEADKTDNNDNNQTPMSESQLSSATTAAEGSSYSRSRCGGALRTEREKQGLSVQDVASKLKISSRQIESIEADQFASLPESTIVRGFIRNYAKLLKMQAEPLLDAYKVLEPTKEPLAFMLKPSSTMKVGDYKKPNKTSFFRAALLLLLAIGLWFFYKSYIQKPSPILPTEPSKIIEPLPQPALPAAERQEQSIDLTLPASETTDAAPAATTVNPDSNLEGIPATPFAKTVNPKSPALKSVETSTNETKPVETNLFQPDERLAKLEFDANQETWISVVDANGKEIYNKTIFAGSRERFVAKPPIDLVIGNASGVEVSMNNKPLNLGPHTRSNVARVKVDKIEFNQFE